MSASSSKRPSLAKNAGDARAAVHALARLRGKKDLHIRIRSAGRGQGVETVLPREAFEILVDALALMASGQTARVISTDVELTTQEAAEMLNVSRPFLVALLDDGKIPHRLVGSHRRVRAAEVLTYKANEDAKRRGVLDQLTTEAEKLGLGY